jgi:hypothetical protein
VLGLATTVASQSLTASLPGALPGNGTNANAVPGGPVGGGGEGPPPLALPISLTAAAALTLVLAVVSEAARIVAVRTLVSDETGRIPGAFVRRNIGLATINGLLGALVVGVLAGGGLFLALVIGTTLVSGGVPTFGGPFGAVVVGVLVGIGLLLLFALGVFLAVAFFFVRQEIAVEDENFVDAMADSWTLTGGDRVEVFVVALVVVALDVVASLPGFALAFLDPAVGALVGIVLGAVATVFGIAVACRAYDQLRAEREEGVDALGPDDLEEPT